jgi:hypothetical protein
MCQRSVNFFKMKAILFESGDQCWTVTQFGGMELQDLGRKKQIRRIRSEFWNQFQFNSNQDMELAGFHYTPCVNQQHPCQYLHLFA